MFKNHLFVLKYLLYCIFPIIFSACVSISSNQNNLNGFIEVDRFYIEYDEELY
jgi:hypothetical protein